MDNPPTLDTYNPTFLHPDETEKAEGVRSIHEPSKARGVKPSPGTYLEYQANLEDLRLMSPYLTELRTKLDEKVHVLQFKTTFSIDFVPEEWVYKESPLLKKVKVKGALGFVTDQDPKTFYFPSKEDSDMFLAELNGMNWSGPSSDEILERRDNIKKFIR